MDENDLNGKIAAWREIQRQLVKCERQAVLVVDDESYVSEGIATARANVEDQIIEAIIHRDYSETVGKPDMPDDWWVPLNLLERP